MLKQMLGHDGPPQLHAKNLLTGEPFARCPMRTLLIAEEREPALVREVEMVRLELFPPYRDHGVLPVAGGLLDQPAKTMDYLRLFRGFDRLSQAKYDEITYGTGGATDSGEGEG
jgi:hypothetical protein